MRNWFGCLASLTQITLGANAQAYTSDLVDTLKASQRQAQAILAARDTQSVREYYHTHSVQYRDWMEARRERARSRLTDTLENPSVTTLESLVDQAKKTDFEACKAQLQSLSASAEFIFECVRLSETFLGDSYRYFELKSSPQASYPDLRPVLQVLNSASPAGDELTQACQLLSRVVTGLRCKEVLTPADLAQAWNRLFEVQVRNLRFSWSAGVLTIPMDASDSEAFELMSKAVEQYWNQVAGVRIRLVPGSGGIRMIRRAGALAAADRIGGYRIQWDPTLDRVELLRSLAHELGHLIGFADTYINFWDADAQGVVYYELDRTNLMSSHSGSILPLHGESIRRAYGKPR